MDLLNEWFSTNESLANQNWSMKGVIIRNKTCHPVNYSSSFWEWICQVSGKSQDGSNQRSWPNRIDYPVHLSKRKIIAVNAHHKTIRTLSSTIPRSYTPCADRMSRYSENWVMSAFLVSYSEKCVSCNNHRSEKSRFSFVVGSTVILSEFQGLFVMSKFTFRTDRD